MSDTIPTGKEFADTIASRNNPGRCAVSYVFLVEAEHLDEDGEVTTVLLAREGGSWLARRGLAYEYLNNHNPIYED